MSYKKICAMCGKEFETIYPNKNYCSKECYNINRSNRDYDKYHKKNPDARTNHKNKQQGDEKNAC